MVQRQISIGAMPPSRERYRLIPPSLFPELRRLLQGMLDSGVVSESSSPWPALIVLVKKKDDTWKFCNDYWKLIAVAHKDAFPLPQDGRVPQTVHVVYHLGLASRYWEMEVDPGDL